MLFLHDLTRVDATEYIAADAVIAKAIAEKLSQHVPVIDVWNKQDTQAQTVARPGISLSAKTGAGLDDLRQQLLRLAGWQPGAEGVFMARERHVQALRAVQAHVLAAQAQLAAALPALDILAEELRLAQNGLNEITGEFSSDDLLGVIFSKFCIGK